MGPRVPGDTHRGTRCLDGTERHIRNEPGPASSPVRQDLDQPPSGEGDRDSGRHLRRHALRPIPGGGDTGEGQVALSRASRPSYARRSRHRHDVGVTSARALVRLSAWAECEASRCLKRGVSVMGRYLTTILGGLVAAVLIAGTSRQAAADPPSPPSPSGRVDGPPRSGQARSGYYRRRLAVSPRSPRTSADGAGRNQGSVRGRGSAYSCRSEPACLGTDDTRAILGPARGALAYPSRRRASGQMFSRRLS